MRFLTQLETIRAAIQQGYPLRIIYEERREGFGISYSQFIRYVNRFINPAGDATPIRHKGATGAHGNNPLPQAKGPTSSTPAGFQYLPIEEDDDLV